MEDDIPEAMTMARYRYDRDLDCLVELRDDRNYFEPSVGPQIMPDIQDYKTVAGDIANDGAPAIITSRSRHREFLQRNGLVEVGNDYDKRQVNEGQPRRLPASTLREMRERRIEAIKRAADLVRSGEHRNIRFRGE